MGPVAPGRVSRAPVASIGSSCDVGQLGRTSAIRTGAGDCRRPERDGLADPTWLQTFGDMAPSKTDGMRWRIDDSVCDGVTQSRAD